MSAFPIWDGGSQKRPLKASGDTPDLHRHDAFDGWPAERNSLEPHEVTQ